MITLKIKTLQSDIMNSFILLYIKKTPCTNVIVKYTLDETALTLLKVTGVEANTKTHYMHFLISTYILSSKCRFSSQKKKTFAYDILKIIIHC